MTIDVQREAAAEMRLYILPLLLTCIAYVNSLAGDFVHDDLSAVRYNEDVTAAGASADGTSAGTSSRAGIWSNDFWGTAMSDAKSHKSYRPLTVLSFRLNYLMGGLNPIGYHVVNVVLHGAVTLIFARLCRQQLEATWRASVISAGLFAIHSIHTEAVAGIVGRADILATFFFLLSFSSYHRLMEGGEELGAGRRCFHWASSVIFGWASLTAKEHGIAALPVALLFDVTTSARSKTATGKRIMERIDELKPTTRKKAGPFHRVVLASTTVVLMILWRLFILDGQLPTFSDQDNPLALCHQFLTRLLSLLYLPAVNFGLLLAPVTLSYDWQTGSIPVISTWSDGRNGISLLFYISTALVLAVAFTRANKIVTWSALVMIVPMVPCSNLFYVVGFVVAERLLYMPSLGFCLLVGYGLDKLLNSTIGGDVDFKMRNGSKRSRTDPPNWKLFMKRLIVLSAVATAASLLLKTICRNCDWNSRDTLFSSGLKAMPHNAKIHYNYANLQRDLGDWDQAVFHYRRAIQLWPSYSSAHNNLGTLLLGWSARPSTEIERNRLVDESESHFRGALAVHPKHVHARYNLAIISICYRDDLDRAVSLLIDCLALDPGHRPAKKLLNWLTDGRHRPPGPSQSHKVNKTGSARERGRDWHRASITMDDLRLVLLETN